jgi:hypothetical protein
MNRTAKRIKATVKVGGLPASIRDQLGLLADEHVRVNGGGVSILNPFDD